MHKVIITNLSSETVMQDTSMRERWGGGGAKILKYFKIYWLLHQCVNFIVNLSFSEVGL